MRGGRDRKEEEKEGGERRKGEEVVEEKGVGRRHLGLKD